jgi:hypothetical protein
VGYILQIHVQVGSGVGGELSPLQMQNFILFIQNFVCTKLYQKKIKKIKDFISSK